MDLSNVRCFIIKPHDIMKLRLKFRRHKDEIQCAWDEKDLNETSLY